eukprot:1979948-Prymnesium_polylepis.1
MQPVSCAELKSAGRAARRSAVPKHEQATAGLAALPTMLQRLGLRLDERLGRNVFQRQGAASLGWRVVFRVLTAF